MDRRYGDGGGGPGLHRPFTLIAMPTPRCGPCNHACAPSSHCPPPPRPCQVETLATMEQAVAALTDAILVPPLDLNKLLSNLPME